jgi:hypothetical protein
VYLLDDCLSAVDSQVIMRPVRRVMTAPGIIASLLWAFEACASKGGASIMRAWPSCKGP